MCLWVKSIDTEIAKRDIVCYKVLVKVTNNLTDETDIITPFQGKKVPKACLNGNELFYSETTDPYLKFDWEAKYFVAGDGFIHTYKRRRTAKKLARLNPNSETVIYRCIIPAGTEYYAGIDEGMKRKAYASKAIKFVKQI